MKRASFVVLSFAVLTASGVRHETAPERIRTHDNELAAGTLRDGVLRLQLETRRGTWYPHGDDGPSAEMVAFNRFRLINITIGRPGIRVGVKRDSALAHWRALAKDGADLPHEAQVMVPARRPITIGETYDFELTPRDPGEMRLEVRSGTGVLIAFMPLVVR